MSSDFSVVAIVSAYNEADIIGQVVGDLIAQGIQVFFLDDGSTDGTLRAVEAFEGRGVVGIEHLPPTSDRGASPVFCWERILARKAQLARELDASWFVHHDADEFRESPWPHLSLRHAIQRVDALGFNAIDFASLDFWPSDADLPRDDVRQRFPFYSRGARYDHLQVRCWKKAPDVDLVSSGGHEARFAGRKIFPLRFLLRHYPIRGQAHGERKVFGERRDRYLETERARGWHVQYDAFQEGDPFVRDARLLTRYDPDAVRLELLLRHRGVEELEEALDARNAEIERLRHELVAHVRELACRSRELARMHQEVSDLSRGLASVGAALETRTADVVARDAEIARLAAAIAERTSDLNGWRSAFADAHRRIQALEGSLSWRWTAPARALYGVLRRSR
jgi:hypothetical protein